MGAIVYTFDSVPLFADPRRAQLYAGIYADLAARGLAVPVTASNVITRAALIAHLQAVAGQLIKDELTTNPEGIDYAGTDANTADVICKPYVPPNVRRLPGSSATGYRVLAGTTAQLIVLGINPGLGNPLFTALAADPLNPLNQSVGLRFRLTATDPLNRRAMARVRVIMSDTTLEVFGSFPAVPTVGDIADLGYATEPTLPGRMQHVLSGFPHGPNSLTAADITAAKV